MANRFPLIVDSSTQRIKEIAVGDNIDLTKSGIANADHLQSTGTTVGVTTVTTANITTATVSTTLDVDGAYTSSVSAVGGLDIDLSHFESNRDFLLKKGAFEKGNLELSVCDQFNINESNTI